MKLKLLLLPFLVSVLLACDSTVTDDLTEAEQQSVDDAKAFIAEVRALGDTVTIDSAKNFADSIKAAFLNQAEDSDALLNEDFGSLLKALRTSIRALRESYPNLLQAEIGSSTPYTNETDDADLLISVASGLNGEVEFSITGTVGDNDVDLTAALATPNGDGFFQITFPTGSFGIDFSLSGLVENPGAKMTISDGAFGFAGTVGPAMSGKLSIDTNAMFMVNVMQKSSDEVTNPLSFDGSMTMDMNDFSLRTKLYKCHPNADVHGDKHFKDCAEGQNLVLSVTPMSFESFSVTLDGSIADTDGNSFAATMDLMVDGANFNGFLDFDFDDDEDGDDNNEAADDSDDDGDEGVLAQKANAKGVDWNNEEWTQWGSEDWDNWADQTKLAFRVPDWSADSFDFAGMLTALSDSFTEDNYIGVDFSLLLTADLVGVDEPASLSVDISRGAPGTGVLDLELNIEGKTFTASHAPDQDGLQVTSGDGIELNIDFVRSEEGDTIGDLVVDGNIVGSLTRIDGALTLLYIDGTYDTF